MTGKSGTLGWTVGVTIGLFVVTGVVLFGQQYRGLQGVTSVDAVFDVRIGEPQKMATHLGLLHQTFADESLTAIGRPGFTLVFSGPSVRLLSRNTEGASSEERDLLEQISERLSAMAADGIRLEVCLIAATTFGVDPDSFVPGIDRVPNGWISLIGYQAKGHAQVALF